jgi:hypothetical protein
MGLSRGAMCRNRPLVEPEGAKRGKLVDSKNYFVCHKTPLLWVLLGNDLPTIVGRCW